MGMVLGCADNEGAGDGETEGAVELADGPILGDSDGD